MNSDDNRDSVNDETKDTCGMPQLERNILGKFDIQHKAKEMNPFSHRLFEIENHIIVGFDFSKLKRETPGSEVFRVRICFHYTPFIIP